MNSNTLSSTTANGKASQNMTKKDRNPRHGYTEAQMTALHWADNLLAKMAEQPVRITRTEANKLLQVTFGAAGLRGLPKDRGQVILRLPNSNDALVLEFAADTRAIPSVRSSSNHKILPHK
jgi:hypothetical protein